MYLKIAKIREVKTPTRAYETDAGIDFYLPDDCFTDKDGGLTIHPGENYLIPSGIKVEVPNGYALVAFNKSGVATKKNIFVGSKVVDAGYSGEILIDLHNLGNQRETLQKGSKVIQFLLLPVIGWQPVEVDENELYNGVDTARNCGGFGSTDGK